MCVTSAGYLICCLRSARRTSICHHCGVVLGPELNQQIGEEPVSPVILKSSDGSTQDNDNKQHGTGKIKTICPECGAENLVEVIFPAYNQGFKARDFDCLVCGIHLTVKDQHRYLVDGTIE